MKLELKRFYRDELCTVGKLYIDGVYQCYILEDCERELDGEPVETWKIHGMTAIPKGTYKVRMSFSNRFQKILPELIAVPGFLGVRIHPGNTSEDTEGCLITGETWEQGANFVGNSRKAFNKIFAIIEKEKNLSITIS